MHYKFTIIVAIHQNICIIYPSLQPSTGKKGAGGGGASAGASRGGARTPLAPRTGGRVPGGAPLGLGGPPGARSSGISAGRPSSGRPAPYDRPRGVSDRYGPPGAPPPRNGGGKELNKLTIS